MYSVETSTYVLHSLYCPQIGIAGQGAGQAAKFIQNNYIPIPFVIMLLLQFLSMLVDRLVQWSVCVCMCILLSVRVGICLHSFFSELYTYVML